MSNPSSNQPRKLLRSRSNRVIGGVCGGVADYLNMDPTVVRLLAVVLTAFTGIPVVLYLIALFVVPEGPITQHDPASTAPSVRSAAAEHDRTGYGTPSVTDPVWGPAGAPWEQQQPPAPAVDQPLRQPANPAAGTSGGQPGDQTLR